VAGGGAAGGAAAGGGAARGGIGEAGTADGSGVGAGFAGPVRGRGDSVFLQAVGGVGAVFAGARGEEGSRAGVGWADVGRTAEVGGVAAHNYIRFSDLQVRDWPRMDTDKTRDRLVYGYAILRTIDFVRTLIGDERACDEIERFIVDRELAYLALIACLEAVDTQIEAARRAG